MNIINVIKRMSLFFACSTPLFAGAPALAGALAVGASGAAEVGGTVAAAGAVGGVAEIGGAASAGAFLANPVVLGVIIGVGVLVLVGGGVYLIVRHVKKKQRAAQANEAQAAAAVAPDIPPQELAIRNQVDQVIAQQPANTDVRTEDIVRQVLAAMAVLEERNQQQRAEEYRIQREKDRNEDRIEREKERNQDRIQKEKELNEARIQKEKERNQDRIERKKELEEFFEQFQSQLAQEKIKTQEKEDKIDMLEADVTALKKELAKKNLIIHNLQKKPIVSENNLISSLDEVTSLEREARSGNLFRAKKTDQEFESEDHQYQKEVPGLKQVTNQESFLTQKKEFAELNLKMPARIKVQQSEEEKVDRKALEETQESVRKLLDVIGPTLIYAQRSRGLTSSGLSNSSNNPHLSFFSVLESDIPQELLESELGDGEFVSVPKNMSN
jgi:hypothetical protein